MSAQMAFDWQPVTGCNIASGRSSLDDVMLCFRSADEENHASRFSRVLVSQITNLQSTLHREHNQAIASLMSQNRVLRERLSVLDGDSVIEWPSAHNPTPKASMDLDTLVPDEREPEPGLHATPHSSVDLQKFQRQMSPLSAGSLAQGGPAAKLAEANSKVFGSSQIKKFPRGRRTSAQKVGLQRTGSIPSKSRSDLCERGRSSNLCEGGDLPSNLGERSNCGQPLRSPSDLSSMTPPPPQQRESKWKVSPYASKSNEKIGRPSRSWAASISLWEKSLDRGEFSLKSLVNSNEFIGGYSAVLFSYAIFIAVETQLLALQPERDTTGMTALHIVFSILFTVEICIRFAADGRSFFWGEGWVFNCFDTALVVSLVIDIIMAIMQISGDSPVTKAGSLMRTLRIIRVVRTMRLVRTFRHLHEFQKMAFALGGSLKTLLCAMLVILFVMFFFAVIFTQGASDRGVRQSTKDLQLRYGSLTDSLHTLFMAVTNGLSWNYAYVPLFNMGPWFGRIFVVYVFISLFGVLNVVTSIFVECVIRSAQHHREVIVQDKEKEKHVALRHMQEVFRQMDLDGSGQVTSEELEYFLREPHLSKYMEALDVSPEDTRLLFSLLDQDGSNQIDINEFCEGCLRLKGNARSIDLHALILQIKNFLKQWADFTDFAAECLEQQLQAVGKSPDFRSMCSNSSLSVACPVAT